MTALRARTADRIAAAIGTAALQALLLYALIAGLAPGLPARISDGLKLFDVTPPPPPPPEKIVPKPQPSRKPEGAAAPPNLRSKPAEIVVPPPIVPLIVPPPVVAAPVRGTGADPRAGASDRPGPGTGAGGEGDGRGSGGSGDGEGGGEGTPPEWLRGRIRDSDYPRAAAEAGVQGSLTVRYVVGIDGRVANCTVEQSSRSAALDETTCRLIRERFRFRPARDASGRPVAATIVEDHEWIIDPD